MTTQDGGPALDAATRTRLIDATLSLLTARYVYPEVATRMEAAIRERQATGEYDAITSGTAFRDALTAHLQAVSRDKHLQLRYSSTPRPQREGSIWDDPAVLAAYFADAAINNYGVKQVERLAGNVGYLLLTSVDEAEYAARTFAAAMAMLSNTSAMIVDLRRNNGGAPSGVAFLCSYFFPPEPVHLNDIFTRTPEGGTTQQFWTLPYLPGERYLDKPVYVLTSNRTFSGAEEFAYDLQQLRRATIVGETTAGGANPVDAFQLDANFEVRLPTARAINPVSGTDWEGTGVTPDVEVDADQALDVAHVAALHAILAALGEEPTGAGKGLADEVRAALAEQT